MRRPALIAIGAVAAMAGTVLFLTTQRTPARMSLMVRNSNAAAQEERPAAGFLQLQLDRAAKDSYVVSLTNTGDTALKIGPLSWISLSFEFYSASGEQIRVSRTHVTWPEGAVPRLSTIKPGERRNFTVEKETLNFFYAETRGAVYMIARYKPDEVERAELPDCDVSGVEVISEPLKVQ